MRIVSRLTKLTVAILALVIVNVARFQPWPFLVQEDKQQAKGEPTCASPPSPLRQGNQLVTKSLDYSLVKKYPLVVVDCAANGEFPILMQNVDIIGWVCNREKAVTMAMLYVFDKYASRGEHGLMLDIGANAGYYSLLAARLGHDAIQFDLQPECLTILRNSVIANGFEKQIWTVMAGVSETAMNISVPETGCNGRFPAVAHEKKTYGKYKSFMPVHPLDTFIDIDGRDVMLMKVDTEGNEKRVLAGAMEFFRQHKIKNAIIEVTPGHGFWKNEGISPDEVVTLLREIYSFGYHVACLDNLKLLASVHELEHYVRRPFRAQMDLWFTLDENVRQLDFLTVNATVPFPRS